MNMIEQIKADRESGTPGPWEEWLGEIGTEDTCVVEVDSIDTGQGDINRIARVPDMESALIAADELAKMVEDLPDDEGTFKLFRRLAAYRTAIGDTK